MRHGIDDMRDLFNNDVRFLEPVLGVADARSPVVAARASRPIDGDPDRRWRAAFGDLGTGRRGDRPASASGLDGIVVARVLDLRPHPDADHIQLVDVDAGDGEPLQICCGAFNMAVGDLVPLATLGTVMPNGMEIGRRKMRGEWSNGMLCSAPELGLRRRRTAASCSCADGRAPGTPLDRRARHRGRRRSTTSRSTRTGPTPCRWPAWPATWPPPSACRSPSRPASAVPIDATVERAPVEIVDARPVRPLHRHRVLDGITIGPSPAWLARRLDPARHAADQQRRRRVELRDARAGPAQPPLRPRPPARGGALVVRRARRRRDPRDPRRRRAPAGRRRLPDLRRRDRRRSASAGSWAAPRSEISATTTHGAARDGVVRPDDHRPHRQAARAAQRGPARFERGIDPEIVDLAVDRFASLLPGVRAVPPSTCARPQSLPDPRRVRVRTARVNAMLGT